MRGAAEHLGHDEAARLVVPHIDDVGCARGANRAFAELHGNGFVTTGSVIVPAAGFADAADLAAGAPGTDLGVHLTLTSESPNERWRPLAARTPASGLVDSSGHFWPTVAEVRANADPVAVDEELRAQVEAALGGGIDVTHLDHHMGASLAPELAANTLQMAEDYRLPVLVPRRPRAYFSSVHMTDVDATVLEDILEDAAGTPTAFVVDEFAIGLEHREEPVEVVTKRLVSSARPGVTFLSLHCSAPGDIERVHPSDHAWRVGEYRLLGDEAFLDWVADQDVELIGLREVRDRITRAA